MSYVVNGDSFTDRQKLTIKPSAENLTDYQIKRTVEYDSVMNSDFSDIRFTTESGVNISYWIESKTDSDTADIWLKVPYILTTIGAEIWMYYGNSGLSSAGSGSNTFIQYHGATTTDYLDSLSVSPSNIIYESFLKVTSSTHNNIMGLSNSATIADDGIYYQLYDNGNLRRGYSENENTATIVSEPPDVVINSYVNLKITHDGSTIHYYIDDNEISTGSTTNFPDEDLGLFLWNASGTSIQDWAFVRQYTAIEPTWTSEDILKQLHKQTQFRLLIEDSDGNIYYPDVISGSTSSVYPFAVPTARFTISSNSAVSTSTYISPIRNDNVVRFQVNQKYTVGERDVWIDIFEGRVNGIRSVFNQNENTTTIRCIGHGESLKYTSTPATVGHTAKTTGYILETLMPAMARISDTDTLIDIAGSTSISQFDLKEDSQKIMDVIRDLESLELYGYIFRLTPVYDTDGLLTSVEPVWEAISSTATDILAINEYGQSMLSADFESNISNMCNLFTMYGGGATQVSSTVEDSTLQVTYDVREKVEVDKSIATAAMCTNIATAAVTRWKNPIISGTVTIRGNPYIRVGDRVTCDIPSVIIDGEPIDDTYLIYRVTHNIEDGYTTTLVLGEIDMSASELITSFILGDRRNNLNGID